MSKPITLKILLSVLILTASASAQFGSHDVLYVGSAPAGSCTAGSRLEVVITPGTLYSCQNGTWAQITGGGGAVSSVFTRTGAVVAANNDYTEDLIGGAAAAKTMTEAGAGDVVTRAGVETAALTAPWVIQDTNSSNSNTSAALIASHAGTSVGGIGFIANTVSGTAAGGGDIIRGYFGASVTAGLLAGGTLEFELQAGGSALFGAGALLPTLGTSGGWFAIEGTAPTGTSTNYGMYNDSTSHCPTVLRQSTNVGCAMGVNGTNTFGTAGIIDMSAATGATAFKVPVIAGATAGADGVIDYDSTAKSTKIRAAGLDAVASAVICRTIQKNETTSADANVLTCTPASVAGTYRISIAISVSAATSGVIGWTATWTDSNGNAQAPTNISFFQISSAGANGTAAPALTFTTSAASNYAGVQVIDVNNAGTNIVIKWTGGGTTTAKMTALVEKIT